MIELCNKNDGSHGTQSTPGPYEIYVNNQKQAIFVGDGGSQNMQSTWGASYPKLSCVMLGCGYAEITTGGALSIAGGTDAIFGALAATGVLSAAQRGELRAYFSKH